MRRRILVVGLALTVILLAGICLWLVQAATVAQVLAAPVIVQIPAGTGAADVARRLATSGVIRSAVVFRAVTAVHGVNQRLQAGEYEFSGKLSIRDVVHILVDGEVLLHALTIPEGLTRKQIIELMEGGPVHISGDVAVATANTDLIQDLDPVAGDLEGYLFPDTYQVASGTSADVVVASMVNRFRMVTEELAGQTGENPRVDAADLRAWVTLASLVEKETGLRPERSRVAGVFVNRLELGMPLQCDPTVVYALEAAGIPQEGSLAHWLDLDHAYNTYRHTGLPPGPIANPGRASLAAALQPQAGNDLYFVADGEGGHRFSPTLAEHNRAVRQWRQHQAGRGNP
jgi:UPF0755 protein